MPEYCAPGPLAIAQAVPPGSRRAAGQRAWLADVSEAIAASGFRADRRANWESAARIIAWCADWRTRTTMPTWDRLAARAGRVVDENGERRPLSRSTVARVLRWLRDHGYLGTVEHGSVPWLRPMALASLEGNRAAVYVLTTPGRHSSKRAVRVTDTPSRPRRGLEAHRARARGGKSSADRRPPGTHPEGRRPSGHPGSPAPRPARAPDPVTAPAQAGNAFSAQGRPAPAGPWRPADPPKKRIEEVAAAAAVRNVSAAARAISDRHVAHLCRDFFRAGWSPSDILRAIDYQPGGRQWHRDAGVLHPAAWLRFRLGHWRDGSGVLPSPAAAGAAAAAAKRERQRLQRAEAEQAAAAAAPPGRQAAAAAAARAALAAASPRAGRIIALAAQAARKKEKDGR